MLSRITAYHPACRAHVTRYITRSPRLMPRRFAHPNNARASSTRHQDYTRASGAYKSGPNCVGSMWVRYEQDGAHAKCARAVGARGSAWQKREGEAARQIVSVRRAARRRARTRVRQALAAPVQWRAGGSTNGDMAEAERP